MSDNDTKQPVVEENPANTTQKTEKGEEKGTTDNQTNSWTQEKIDAIVSKRVSEKEASLEKKFQEDLKAKLEEERRLAKLSADEREKELLAKQKEANEQRDRALTERENKLEAINKLDEYGIPVKFADLFVSTDKEVMLQKIEIFKSEYDKAVDEAVNAKLAISKSQSDPNSTTSTTKPSDTIVRTI